MRKFWGGDFNLVLDTAKGGNPSNHRKANKIVLEIKDNLDLTDIWRGVNPDTNRYMWRQTKP